MLKKYVNYLQVYPNREPLLQPTPTVLTLPRSANLHAPILALGHNSPPTSPASKIKCTWCPPHPSLKRPGGGRQEGFTVRQSCILFIFSEVPSETFNNTTNGAAKARGQRVPAGGGAPHPWSPMWLCLAAGWGGHRFESMPRGSTETSAMIPVKVAEPYQRYNSRPEAWTPFPQHGLHETWTIPQIGVTTRTEKNTVRFMSHS